jgi:hypothetical protein
MFEGLNWNNVFIAGGSILGKRTNIEISLTLFFTANVVADADVRNSFKSSDIDIFLCGLKSDQEANEKVEFLLKLGSYFGSYGISTI